MKIAIFRRLGWVGLAIGLASAPAFGDALDQAVSAGQGGASSAAARAPSPGPNPGTVKIPAGAPFTGVTTITAADLKASGARPATGPLAVDPLAPELAAEMAAAPESIINWDSRMRYYTALYPNRAIVYIQYNGSHLCSGAMISRNTVLTAGHCVHTGGASGVWRKPGLFRVYPGRDGTSAPYGSCGVTRLHSVAGWTQHAKFTHDYGAMRLDCSIGNTVGWFGTYKPSSRVLRRATTRVIGYPGDHSGEQWGASDRVRDQTRRNFCYRDDTIGGVSGAPVWNDRSEARASNGAWAFGIHAYGTSGSSICGGPWMNGATRINDAVLRNIVKWINQP